MASKSVVAIALLLNVLFFTMVSANHTPGCPPPPHKPKPTPSPSPKPKPTPSPSPKPKPTCPKDTLKLGVCADVLGGLLHVIVGTPEKEACCGLLRGLADLDAAVCLCTAIKANILGINLNVPVSLSLLLNYCGKKVPSGYQCA